jgi:hypothetical protein
VRAVYAQICWNFGESDKHRGIRKRGGQGKKNGESAKAISTGDQKRWESRRTTIKKRKLEINKFINHPGKVIELLINFPCRLAVVGSLNGAAKWQDSMLASKTPASAILV